MKLFFSLGLLVVFYLTVFLTSYSMNICKINYDDSIYVQDTVAMKGRILYYEVQYPKTKKKRKMDCTEPPEIITVFVPYSSFKINYDTITLSAALLNAGYFYKDKSGFNYFNTKKGLSAPFEKSNFEENDYTDQLGYARQFGKLNEEGFPMCIKENVENKFLIYFISMDFYYDDSFYLLRKQNLPTGYMKFVTPLD